MTEKRLRQQAGEKLGVDLSEKRQQIRPWVRQLAWQPACLAASHWLRALVCSLAVVWSLAAVAMMVLALAPPVVLTPVGCLQHPPLVPPLLLPSRYTESNKTILVYCVFCNLMCR